MLLKYFVSALIVPVLIGSAVIEDVSNVQNEFTEMDYNRAPADYGGNFSGTNGGNVGNTWLDTARNAIYGPAGQMVVHMAKEMISRSTGNSQVNYFEFGNVVFSAKNLFFSSECAR